MRSIYTTTEFMIFKSLNLYVYMIGLLTIVLFKAKEHTIPLNYYANFSLILMKLGMEVKNGEQSF